MISKIRAAFSTNEKQTKSNRYLLVKFSRAWRRLHVFPVLIGSALSTSAVIGHSTLVLVLRYSFENLSMITMMMVSDDDDDDDDDDDV